jgi:hypothetical protein
MLTSLDLTSRVPVFACTIAFLARMVLACMVLMRMWLRLDVNQEVVPILPNRMHQAIISVWPLAFLLKALLQIVLCKFLLGDILVQESRLRGLVRGRASEVCAFDQSHLLAADAIIVVVDRGLENCGS